MKSVVNGRELQGMVQHWLATPPNGYLGDDYGSDPKEMLLTPMKSGVADRFIKKLRTDIPLAGALPSSAVNVYAQDVANRNDAKKIIIEVGDTAVSLDNVERSLL